jgi:hypothetical protein
MSRGLDVDAAEQQSGQARGIAVAPSGVTISFRQGVRDL